MASWLYPITKRSRKNFRLNDCTEVEVSSQNYAMLLESGRLREDQWWSVSKNFNEVQVNDEIFIYTGDKDLGIIGCAVVIDKQGYDRKTWAIRLKHNLKRSRMLYKQPIPAQKVRGWIHFPQGAVYSLQGFETKLKQLLPWEPTSKTVEVEKDIINFAENKIAQSEGQRINTSQKAKHAIEKYSMNRAKKYFEDLGYVVKDVSRTHSYDLHCTKGAKELLVEVKGTQSDGQKILLTKNEVRNTILNKGEISLYILHSINVIETAVKCEAVKGTAYVVNPWQLRPDALTPMIYEYKILK